MTASMVEGRCGWQPARGRDQEGDRLRQGVDHRGGEGSGARTSARSPSRARWPRRTATVRPPRRRLSRRSARWATRRRTPRPACRSSSSRTSVWTRRRASPRSPRTPPPSIPKGSDAAGAFEKLMLAIETGQSRGLRTMSLFPDLARGRGDRAVAGATPRQDALRHWRSSRSGTTPSWRRRRRSRGPLRKRRARSTAR